VSDKKVNVAMIGLGFGAEFIPIYQAHPNANMVAICRRNQSEMDKIGDAFGIEKRYSDFQQVLGDPEVDAVHINTPIPDHAPMSIAALKAGKHVACTVPMATTVDQCREICELVAETGLKYMMAETVVYSREFLFIKEMYDKGELGKIQYMQASHPQDMEGWPEYWERMIPMHYATHVVSPVLGLVGGRAEYVSCFGSGTINERLAEKSGNRFAVESTHLAFPVRHVPSVPRELRRLRLEEELRMGAHRGGGARHSHGQEARARDPRAGDRARLRPSAARADPQVHVDDSGRGAPLVHPGRGPRRVAPAPGQRVRVRFD